MATTSCASQNGPVKPDETWSQSAVIVCLAVLFFIVVNVDGRFEDTVWSDELVKTYGWPCAIITVRCQHGIDLPSRWPWPFQHIDPLDPPDTVWIDPPDTAWTEGGIKITPIVRREVSIVGLLINALVGLGILLAMVNATFRLHLFPAVRYSSRSMLALVGLVASGLCILRTEISGWLNLLSHIANVGVWISVWVFWFSLIDKIGVRRPQDAGTQDAGTQDAGTRSGRKVNRPNAAKRSNRRP